MNILIISIVAIVCVPVFLILEICQLKTEVDTDGIRLNFRPFTKKSYAWSDVETAELIDYGFVGGWGIRLGTKYGTVYNTKGREGLWLTFNDGKKIVIGTQRKAAMKSTVQKVFHRN